MTLEGGGQQDQADSNTFPAQEALTGESQFLKAVDGESILPTTIAEWVSHFWK